VKEKDEKPEPKKAPEPKEPTPWEIQFPGDEDPNERHD
jgi:hypothetical protein